MRITLLDKKAMGPYENEFAAAFPEYNQGESAIAGAAAAVLVGLAVDYVQSELRKEASLYEAQFGRTIHDDEFWYVPPSGKRVQNYYGFKVERRVGSGDWDEKEKAMVLVVGLAPSRDNQMFRIAPLQLRVDRSKAKVLSDQVYTWLLPWTWVGKAIRVPGHEIGVDVSIEMDAFWRDKDGTLKMDRVAASSFKVTGYDLNSTPLLTPGAGLDAQSGGWLVSMPASRSSDGAEIGLGTFTLKVTVSERDTSNAKEYLEKAATFVGENRATATKAVNDAFAGD